MENSEGMTLLSYNGTSPSYRAEMSYLSGGPYDFSSGTCRVAAGDAKVMIERSPVTFSVVDGFACPECTKVYKREGDLANHVKKEHAGN